MLSIRKGFTLIEILIVLALIGLFVAAASYLTHDNRIAQQKAERLADNINTSFRTARTSMSLGKGVSSGSTLATTDKRVISIGSNGITTTYGTTNTGTESNLPYPFYDNDPNYKIIDISVSSGILINGQMPIWDLTGVTAADITFLNDGSIQISSSDPNVTTRINAIRITAGYEGFEQSVMIDRIMGRSEIVSGKGESTFLVIPPTPVNGVCNTVTYSSCITGMPSGGNLGSCGGSSSWICLGQNGGSDANCSKFNTACVCDSTVPTCSPSGCLLTNGFPPVDNQAWVKGASDCGFSCINGYTGNNCEVAPPNGCNTTLPACNGTTCSLTYLPSSYNQSWVKDAGSCGFTCTGGFTGPTCTTPASIVGFTTTWKVGTPGYGNGDNTVSFAITRISGTQVDWGDGNIESISTDIVSHTYAAAGDKTIKISNITAFRNDQNVNLTNTNMNKLIAVNDWGGITWSSMRMMFAGAGNLNQLPLGAPNMVNVTDTSYMFWFNTVFNQPVANFDTSNVTNMAQMFSSASAFNQPVANFDTSNVTNMSGLFSFASAFNQPVANFDTSNVTNMSGMFSYSAFNQSVANFNTSNVTDMNSMFMGTTAFNQPVANFNTTKVTNMTQMFMLSPFNQSVANFDTSNVTDMSYMFMSNLQFNQPVANFNTTKVTNMTWMFGQAMAFNQSVANFNTANVTSMDWMFANARAFNQSLVSFDTTKVTNMDYMFMGTDLFNQDISTWCVSLILLKPTFFDNGGNAGFVNNAAKQPQWGTCPMSSVTGFTTIWKVGTPGYGNGDNTVRFRVARSAGSMIDWGDGMIESLSTDTPSHLYLLPGDYTIKISAITRFYIYSTENSNQYNATTTAYAGKLTAVNDWGGIAWTSMDGMFSNADHLNQLPVTAPNMTAVTGMNSMFMHAKIFNQSVANFDTSNVTDMSSTFYGTDSFNQSVANFDTSNVTSMSAMFGGALVFNQSVANFDTSNVTNMSYMFGAPLFNQSVANFDTSKVTSMRGMFGGASAFNQSVANFDTSKVTDMGNMFGGASAFNQSLANFNTSLVITMDYMFQNASAFNQSVASFNTSNVTNMSGMFRGTTAFNQPLVTFNTANVTTMYAMFLGSAFNQSLATFNTSNVTNMNRMFSFGSAFNQSLATFNTSKVTDMEAMFANNIVFNQPLSTFNTNLVTTMQSMFQSASAFNQNISNWCVPLIASKPPSFDISGNAGFTGNAAKQPTWGTCPITGFATTWKVGTPGYGNGDNTVAFYLNTTGNYTIDWGDGTVEILSAMKPTHTYATTGNKTITISGSLQRFYTTNEIFNDIASPGKLLSVVDWGNMTWTSFDSMFFNADHLTSLPLTAPNLTNVTNMYRTFFYATSFNQDISNWNTSNVTTMWLTFNGASSFNRPLNSWNMSSVTTIYGMFNGATSFNQPLNSWNTSNVIDMGGLFVQATAFNQDISSWNTVKVTNMGSMFYSATSFNQPLNSWNTNSVTNMEGVFVGATSFNQPLNSWNTSNVLSMRLMFFNASSFNQPLNSWNTIKVTDMSYMFISATSFNQPLNSWNVSNVVSMYKMFSDASAFNQPLNSWNTVKVTNMTEMFSSASAFNQNISNWCVTLIGTKPTNFDVPGNAGFTGNASKQPTWGTCPATNTCTTPGYYSAPSGACYTPLQSPTGWRAAWDACYASGASIANAGAFGGVNYPCGVSGGCGPITGAYKIAWWGGAGDSRDTYDVRSCDATGCPQGAGTYPVDTYATNPFPQGLITGGNANDAVTDTADGTHYYWCEIPAGSTYVWTPSSWGSCSATCGGGTQTRTVKCVRNDGHAAADALCTAAKPATSQGCNPQACGSPAYTACKGSPSTYLPSTTYNFTVGQGDTICSTAYGAGYVWARYTDMDQTLDTNMWNNNQLYVNWARANGSPSSCLASWDTTHRLFMASIGPSSGPGFGLHMIDAFNVSGIVDQTDLSTQGIGAPPNDATTPMAALCSGARPTTLPLVCCK